METNTTSKSYHLCLDLRGALEWPKSRLSRLITDTDTGTRLTSAEAKDWLLDHIAKGRKVIPIGHCDNFSYEDGCQGHPEQRSPEEASPDTASEG